jgi:pimeloyl-ACP methyl ester carboxylesterase
MTCLFPASTVTADESRARHAKPTIVLVHGAWADASSWNGVTTRLQEDGYTVRAIPNQLRSLPGDAASVRAFLQSLSGPVVLVGHS